MECLNMTKTGTQFRSPTTTPILPPESWNHIFQFLSTEDLHSVKNACPEWSELLEETQNSFLLPLALPSLMKYVDVNTTLKFRQISLPTKQIVDKTLQKAFYDADKEDYRMRYYEFPSGQKYLCRVANRLSRDYTFYCDTLQDYLDKVFPDLSLVPSDRNPFLLRHVEYSTGLSQNLAHVTSLLPKFGHHLTSMSCDICADTSNQPFHHIADHLRLVPNLKRLVTLCKFPNCQTVHPVLPRPSGTVIDFPTLHKLTALYIVDTLEDDTQHFVSVFVRHYSQQLTSFTCTASLLALQDLNVDVLNTMFPKIKKFRLIGKKKSDFETGLEKLSNVSWFLERLNLRLYGRDPKNARKVLSMLNNFHQSLVHLEFNFILVEKPELGKGKKSVEEYKDMSKLKMLVCNSRNMKLPVFRQFLQKNCQSLKQLHLEADDIIPMEEGNWALEQIENLEKVVIWNNLPVLPGDSPLPRKITIHQAGRNKSGII